MPVYKVYEFFRDRRQNFDNYYFTLIDEMGMRLKHPVEFTAKYIHSRIIQNEIPLEHLTEIETNHIIKNIEILASIAPKFRGETFIANEYTNPITIDNGKTWIEPIIGKTYQVYKDGYRVLYDEHISMNVKLNRKIEEDNKLIKRFREINKQL